MRDELLKQAKDIMKCRRDAELPPFNYYPCVKHYRTLLKRLALYSNDDLMLIIDSHHDEEWDGIPDINADFEQVADDAWEG